MTIEQIIITVVVAALPSIPLWWKMASEKRKVTADASETLVNTAMELLERLQGRVDALEVDAKKKVEEVSCLTHERDELRDEVVELRREVEALRKEVDALRKENKALKKALKGENHE